MSDGKEGTMSRRELLGGIAAVSALAAMNVPLVHAQADNTINLALIGCGGRGTGAAADALNVRNQGPVKLVALADVFDNRLKSSFNQLSKQFGARVDVPDDRKFVGFDAYQKAMDCLKPGDIAIFATPPAFRWVFFRYAIQKGLHVFMEKPIAVDGPTGKRMIALAEEAKQKNLKVGVGLMCRHCKARGELFQRIKNGEIGDILAMRAYRLHEPGGSFYSGPRPANANELAYQIQRFHSFLWASGGCYSDFYIHHIDECCWMKDAWPVKAEAIGGRHYRGNAIDQNFDNYSVEYTFGDGTKLFLFGRNIDGCHNAFASYAHGTKGLAVVSEGGHTPANVRYYKGQNLVKENEAWRYGNEPNAYQVEWDDLLAAVRQDKPYNEVKRGAEASLVTAMGRMAAHTGQVITYDQMLNCPHEFAPDADKLTFEYPAPLQLGADGKYPIPEPGKKKQREF